MEFTHPGGGGARLGAMVIQARLPLSAPPRPSGPPAPAPPDTFAQSDDDDGEGLTRNEMLRLAGTVLGAGAGAYAGLANGPLAGLLGGASAALPGAVLGSILLETAGEKIFHTKESTTAGLAIAGALAGLAGGATAGFLLGSRLNSPVLAGALGLLGAASAYVSRKD